MTSRSSSSFVAENEFERVPGKGIGVDAADGTSSSGVGMTFVPVFSRGVGALELLI